MPNRNTWNNLSGILHCGILQEEEQVSTRTFQLQIIESSAACMVSDPDSLISRFSVSFEPVCFGGSSGLWMF